MTGSKPNKTCSSLSLNIHITIYPQSSSYAEDQNPHTIYILICYRSPVQAAPPPQLHQFHIQSWIVRVAQNSPIVLYQKFPPFMTFYGYSRCKSAKRLYTFKTNLACSTHLKYTKEILKNTNEKSGNHIFHL